MMNTLGDGSARGRVDTSVAAAAAGSGPGATTAALTAGCCSHDSPRGTTSSANPVLLALVLALGGRLGDQPN